ncbi:glucose-6-phosphate isomerase [Minwuia sp.]|uniref:glucose-6-phosphate isomerase n=1 Tax=Minwuia sp. TaxID=2493630 RepID=UPI003A9500F3
MPLQQYIDACLEETLGENGLSRSLLADLRGRARPCIQILRERLAEGQAPQFGLASRRDDLRGLSQTALEIRDRFAHTIVLGTGGSSLGAQAITALASRASRDRLIFADNLDGRDFADLLDRLEPRETHLLVVSKSGGTTETVAQTLAALQWLRRQVRPSQISRHVLMITEPGTNALRHIADRIGCGVLDHDPLIGGRFSAFSNVGLLPALIAGLDAQALRTGGSQAFEAAIAEPESAPLTGGAITVGLAAERRRSIQVMLPYVGGLERFAHWQRQLWAESLGKDGRGLTPYAALGPVDQHSQLQLWLDGPPDKMFTVITVAEAFSGPVISTGGLDHPDINYLHDRSIGMIVQTQARATIETLVARQQPVRLIRIPRLDERSMGGLLMHFMLETLFAAYLLGLDPYGQPAVETGKRLTRRYLAGSEAQR